MGETAQTACSLQFLMGVSPRFRGGPGFRARFYVKITQRPPDALWSGSGWFGGAIFQVKQLKRQNIWRNKTLLGLEINWLKYLNGTIEVKGWICVGRYSHSSNEMLDLTTDRIFPFQITFLCRASLCSTCKNIILLMAQVTRVLSLLVVQVYLWRK